MATRRDFRTSVVEDFDRLTPIKCRCNSQELFRFRFSVANSIKLIKNLLYRGMQRNSFYKAKFPISRRPIERRQF